MFFTDSNLDIISEYMCGNNGDNTMKKKQNTGVECDTIQRIFSICLMLMKLPYLLRQASCYQQT